MPLPNASYPLIGENLKRVGLILYNQAGNTAYGTFGVTSTGSSPTFIIASFNNFSMLGPVVWTGPIAAIRNAGSNAGYQMIVTELVSEFV